jgi:uncharacterized protein YjbJ (UPF0337 family)
MNKDQVKGKVNDVAGKVERKAGDLTDNGSLEAKGAKNQVKGKAQQTYGDAKDSAETGGGKKD